MQKKVTYDFERLMQGATKVKTSEFANYMIENMEQPFWLPNEKRQPGGH